MKSYSKFFTIILLAAIASSSAIAENNLIKTAIPESQDDINIKDLFYNVWQLYDKQGNRVWSDQAPYSCFSMVEAGWTMKYQDSYIQPYSHLDEDGIQPGDYVALLNYPNNNTEEYDDYNYNLQIAVPSDGEYILTGDVAIVDYREISNMVSLINRGCWLMVTADTKPCEKNMQIVNKNGVNTLEVTRASDKSPVDFAWCAIPRSKDGSNKSFELNLHLKQSYKYLSFYMPSYLMGLANLKLVNSEETNIVEFLGDEQTPNIPVYYNLNGHNLGSDINSLQPGVYIEKAGKQTNKIIVGKR